MYVIFVLKALLSDAVGLVVVLPKKRHSTEPKMRDFVSVPADADMIDVVEFCAAFSGNTADFVFQAIIQIPVKVRRKFREIVTGWNLPLYAKLDENIDHVVGGGHGAVRKRKPLASGLGEYVELEKLFQKFRLVAGMQRNVPKHCVDIFTLPGRKLSAILKDDRAAFHLMAEEVIAIGEGGLDIEALAVKTDRDTIQYQVSHGRGVSSERDI